MNKNTQFLTEKSRVLVTQPYGIGDALFMLPLLKALKQQKKASRIDCILGSRTSQILQNFPYVDDIFVIDKDKWRRQGKFKTLIEKMGLLVTLKKRHYDVLIDLSMQPEYSFWAKFLANIPLRTGFDYRNRNRFLNYPLHLPLVGFSKKHVIEYFCDLARLMGLEITDKKPELKISAEQLEKTKKLLNSNGRSKKYAVVSPGGGVTWGQDAYFKHWPIEYFGQMLKLLKNELKLEEVVVLGIEKEKPLGEYLTANLDLKVTNLCGKTDLIEAAAIIKMAALFLGNDGGLVHLAATQDTPIIALYGPADLRVYGAYPDNENIAKVSKNLHCQPCYEKFRYNRECRSLACLKDLSPQEVFEDLKKRDFFKKLG